jgi:TonB family protein
MTMLDGLLGAGIGNAATALVVAVVVAVITRRLRWPTAIHLLWLVVLVRLVVPPVVGVPILPAVTAPDASGLVSIEAASVGLAEAGDRAGFPVERAAALLWVLGALAIGAVATVRSVRLGRVLEATAPPDAALQRRIEKLAEKLGVSPPRTLLVAGRVPPMLWGRLTGAVLLLPDELLERLAQPQIEALVAHELAHLKRRDHWVRWLELAVTVTWWFNPVTWWARRRLRQAEERCCDAVVARALPDHARAYADTLVETLRFLAGTRVPHAVGAVGMADLSEVQRRLEMILSRTSSRRPKLVSRVVLGCVAVGTLVLTPVLASGGHDRDLPAAFQEEITLNLRDADLAQVISQFGTVTGCDVRIEPSLRGTVTVDLHDVPLHEVLDRVTAQNNAGWRLDHGTLVVFPLDPPQPSPMLVGHLEKEPVYKVEGDISHPKKISAPPPPYPEDCRTERVMGLVVLDTVIDAAGKVVDVSVEESPDNRLSEAAMEAIRSWVFEPATLEGRPVAVRYVLTVNFRLE